MYLADYHTHSNCSPDGTLPMAEMVKAAVDKGLQEICLTDHLDTFYWKDLSLRDDYDWDKAKKQYEEACRLYGDRILIKLGCELGDAQLSPEHAEHLLAAAPELDFIIGSVHLSGAKNGNNKSLFFIEQGDADFYRGVIDDYLDEVEMVAKWGKCSVLGHITLPLRYINQKYHEGLTYAGHMDRVAEIFRIIIPKGIGIEYNTNRGDEPRPYKEILQLYRDMGGEIITLGSDAHSAELVGREIRERQELLRQCGFRYFTTFTKCRPEWQKL